MLLGPHGLALMPNRLLESAGYNLVQDVLSVAAAIINEFIAVILAKKGFELAGEIPKDTAA